MGCKLKKKRPHRGALQDELNESKVEYFRAVRTVKTDAR